MPFLCCIRRQLKECDNDIAVIQNDGDLKNSKSSIIRTVITPTSDIANYEDETKNKHRSQVEKTNDDHSNNNPPINMIGDPINLSSLRTSEDDDSEEEKAAINSLIDLVNEHSTDEIVANKLNDDDILDSAKTDDDDLDDDKLVSNDNNTDISDIKMTTDDDDDKNAVDVGLDVYEKYVSRLEDLAEVIGQKFRGDISDEGQLEDVNCTDVKQDNYLSNVEFQDISGTWIANNIRNNDLVTVDTTEGQSVKIYNCKKVTFKLSGNMDRVEIVDCATCNFIVEDVNNIIIMNSNKLEVQPLKSMSTMNIVNVDGLIVFLNNNHINNNNNNNSTKFFLKKSSEVNFSCPADGDQRVELPLPDQTKTYWNGLEWISEFNSHN